VVRTAVALKRRKSIIAGCDDAPVVEVPWGEPKHVTLIYPYYENPMMLARQVEGWAALPGSVLQWLSFIIVDDGSPDHPAGTVLRSLTRPPRLSLYRIEVDIRWNWIAARNLALFRAEGWCLLTDMDHVCTEGLLRHVVHGAHDPETIYRFSRREHSGEPIKPHPNSWLMTRDMFWKIGGYDEAFSGHYGTDGEYRRRCVKTAPIRILRDELVRHEFQLDASTDRYKRKQPEDRMVQKIIAARGPDWKPKTLSFPWTHVPL
jgi:hypothetical protein